jgi:hypothetical protein
LIVNFILGLTPDDDSTLIHHQAYNEGLLDKPIFSLYFKKCPGTKQACQDGGVVKIGDEDLKNCEPVKGNCVWANIPSRIF